MPDPERDAPPITEEELRQLPRWAIVAFVARCAARIQPLYHTRWKDAPKKYLAALDDAIILAQASAVDPTIANVAAPRGADAAADAAYAAHGLAARADDDDASTAAAAADTAAAAADTAARAADAAAADSAVDPAYAAHALAAHTAVAVDRAAYAATLAGHAATAVTAAARTDLFRLRDAATQEGWTDDTPVPPEFFGPLWPHGKPEGWPQMPARTPEAAAPAGPAKERQLVLKLRIPPLEDTPENRERLKAHLKKIIKATSDLHIAHGGSGLKPKEFKAYVPSRVDEPVGGRP